MTKIMLVEDDKSLREIYGVRLLAEGYDIVSAGDGEEALAMAIKERPNLIVSDVMMPKISGFDMLDILRSTTETRNIKVIMMTALSSEEQRQRGEQLGADRYLVKSQVGIEDVVRVVHEVLEDATPTVLPQQQPVAQPASATPPPPQPQIQPQPAPAQPIQPQQYSMPQPSTTSQPTQPLTVAPRPLTQPPAQPASTPAYTSANNNPQLAAPRQMTSTSTNPVAPSVRSRIIQPLNDPSVATVDLNDLLDKELAKEAGVDMESRPTVATTDQEKAIVDQQLSQFSSQLPVEPETAVNVSISDNGTFAPTPQSAASYPAQVAQPPVSPQQAQPSQPLPPPPPMPQPYQTTTPPSTTPTSNM